MASIARRAADIRITEVDLSTVISVNSNATTAFAGVSSRGPTVPTFYSSFEDFRFDWGDPDASVSFDGYGALQFFTEGNSLWANRAVGAGARVSGVSVKNSSSGVTSINPVVGGVINPKDPQWASYAGAGETALFLLTSKRGPGSYGNRIAVSIESTSISQVASVTFSQATTGGVIPSGTFQYRVAAVGRSGEGLASTVVSVTVASGTTNAVTLNWSPVPGAFGYYIYGRTGTIQRIGVVGATTLTFTDTGTSSVEGTFNPITDPAGLPTQTGIFTLNVFDLDISSTRPVESFECSLRDQVDETGAQMEITQRVNPFSKYVDAQTNIYSLITTPVLQSVTTPVAMAGGASGSAPTSADINNALAPFSDREQYVVDVFINNGRGVPAIQRNMDSMAVNRGDSVAFLDVPSSSQQMQQSIDFRNLTLNLNSSYSALFATDVLISDPVNGKLLFVPPSGAMAALYARTSRLAQPWFSMAGLNRGLLNVLDVRHTYDDGQATNLFRAQLNYPRKFLGRGIPLWEQSTLSTRSSALQFLNVRFLCNIIKRSTYDFLLFGLQEPGDDILRKQLKYGLEEFLKLFQAARGIRDYQVIIDDSNNPPSLVNSGVMVVSVVIIPTLSVREIRMNLIVSKQGLQVTEEEIAAI